MHSSHLYYVIFELSLISNIIPGLITSSSIFYSYQVTENKKNRQYCELSFEDCDTLYIGSDVCLNTALYSKEELLESLHLVHCCFLNISAGSTPRTVSVWDLLYHSLFKEAYNSTENINDIFIVWNYNIFIEIIINQEILQNLSRKKT